LTLLVVAVYPLHCLRPRGRVADVNQAKGKVKVGSSRCLLAIGLIGSLPVRSYDPAQAAAVSASGPDTGSSNAMLEEIVVTATKREERLQDVPVHPHPRRDRKRRWFDGGEAITSVFTNHGGKPNLRLADIDRVEVPRGHCLVLTRSPV